MALFAVLSMETERLRSFVHTCVHSVHTGAHIGTESRWREGRGNGGVGGASKLFPRIVGRFFENRKWNTKVCISDEVLHRNYKAKQSFHIKFYHGLTNQMPTCAQQK